MDLGGGAVLCPKGTGNLVLKGHKLRVIGLYTLFQALHLLLYAGQVLLHFYPCRRVGMGNPRGGIFQAVYAFPYTCKAVGAHTTKPVPVGVH